MTKSKYVRFIIKPELSYIYFSCNMCNSTSKHHNNVRYCCNPLKGSISEWEVHIKHLHNDNGIFLYD